MNTKLSGDLGEDFAVYVLEGEGYTVVERNAKYAGCEADVVCDCYLDANGLPVGRKSAISEFLRKLFRLKGVEKGERTIVFVEVKKRCGDENGSAQEAVTPYKAGRYVTLAKAYLSQHGLCNVNVRFDIFAINGDCYEHIRDAFSQNDAKYPQN